MPKLTGKQREEIIKLLGEGEMTNTAIGEKFSVSQGTVSQIKKAAGLSASRDAAKKASATASDITSHKQLVAMVTKLAAKEIKAVQKASGAINGLEVNVSFKIGKTSYDLDTLRTEANKEQVKAAKLKEIEAKKKELEALQAELKEIA